MPNKSEHPSGAKSTGQSPLEQGPESHGATAGKRGLLLIALVVLTGAAIGYIVGTRTSMERVDLLPGVDDESPRDAGTGWSVAPTNEILRSARHGFNRQRHPAGLERMREDHPDGLTQGAASQEERVRTMEHRQVGRAFEGAPPTIPHPIEQQSSRACLACHEEGMRIGNHVAPQMSHVVSTTCMMCHVQRRSPIPSVPVPSETAPASETQVQLVESTANRGSGPPTASTFEGWRIPPSNPRMWEDAPPPMPHLMQMRYRCTSCHGVFGQGLRSSHAWRENCSRCHLPVDDATIPEAIAAPAE